jgi:hypothetical protein
MAIARDRFIIFEWRAQNVTEVNSSYRVSGMILA